MNEKVVICDCDHENVEEEQRVFEEAGYSFRWLHCVTQEDVIRECSGAEVLLTQYVPMNENLFSQLPSVKCLVRYGVGVDSVNLEDAKKMGVRVCNVPDYGTREVADQALALMMALVRKTHEANNLIHQGIWDYRRCIPVYRTSETVVGIIGLGRIGSAFAQRVLAMDCKVIAYDIMDMAVCKHHRDPRIEMVTLEELLQRSDVISIHCPLNQQTKDLIAAPQLAMMKKNDYLINVARGGIINEKDLDEALEKKEIAGVGLDVVTDERNVTQSPLLRHENLLISPHMAWYSEQSSKELKRKAAEEAVRFLRGEKLRCPVV